MPTAFGVQSTYGLTAPTGYVQSAEQTREVETATIKGANGRVVEAQAKPRSKTTVVVRTKGTAVITPVTVGSDYSNLTVTGSKFTESNDDFGTAEVTGTSFA